MGEHKVTTNCTSEKDDFVVVIVSVLVVCVVLNV